MFIRPTPLAVEHGGRRYDGVWSVSGRTLIARIPGLSSRSRVLAEADDPQAVARQLLGELVDEHATAGHA